MTKGAEGMRRAHLTGNRIRERRLARGLKQAALAEAVGISASYLNLIEHNRRKIGGKLLVALARQLEVEPSALSEGADATLYDTLQAAAQAAGIGLGRPTVERDRIDELAARFPGWTGVIAAQQKKIATLEAMVEGLRDRLGHDPVLAETMHDLLSSVAAIRSTADILAREPDLDVAWRGRFHRNLHEEAERLAGQATEMLGRFEAPSPDAPAASATPIETVEALFEAHDHHFPIIERDGTAGIAQVMARAPGMEDPATAGLAKRILSRYADDAARLPLSVILPAAREAGHDPGALMGLGGGDVALVLRRLAALPPGGDMPEMGLAICDAAGALVFRRRLTSFSIPRFGAGCALWPLYAVLARPGQPETVQLDLPQGARFQAWAVAQPVAQMGFGRAPVLQATMLVRALDGAEAGAGAVPVGPGCHICPRQACPARR